MSKIDNSGTVVQMDLLAKLHFHINGSIRGRAKEKGEKARKKKVRKSQI